MPVAYTSRIAYREEFERLGGQRKSVWECVRNWPTPASLPSTEDVAKETGIRIASVCGRINELVKGGLLQEGGAKASPTSGKTVKTYIALVYREAPIPAKAPEQPDLFSIMEASETEYY